MKTVSLPVAFLLISSSTALSFGSTSPSPWHPTASSRGVVLDWVSPPLTAEVFTRDGVAYARVSLGESGIPEHEGTPAVPVWRALIRIPSQGNVHVTTDHLPPRTVPLAQWGAQRLSPVPRPVPKVPGMSREDEWVLHEEAYASPTRPAGTCTVVPLGMMRGMRIALLEFWPVAYDPSKATLGVIDRATIRITFEAGLEEPDPRVAESWFAWQASSFVLNPPLRDLMPLPSSFLIITVDSLYDAVLPLAQWKTRKAFPTTVTRLSQIPGGPTAANIRAYIQNAYLTWSPPPEYVLLVGDTNTIPAWTGSGYQNPPTDLYYSCVEGTDWIPDLYLGRFSLRAVGDVQGLVEKTVDYEQVAWSVDSLWTRREYFISSDDPSYHGVTEGTHLYCMAKARANGVICDSLWGYYGTGTPIATAVNSGRAMVTYSGHGVETGWQGPSFSRWNVDQLTNVDRYPVVLSFACLTGNFAWTGDQDCFMERWIRRPNKGAVAAYGSSVSSFWGDDDYLQRRMWDALFDNSFNWTGGFVVEGKMRYLAGYNQTQSRKQGYFEQYNLLGDPSLVMHTLVPIPLVASYSPSIPAASPQAVTVTVTRAGFPCANAIVCLYKQGEAHVAAYTNSSGQATLQLPALTPGQLLVTASAPNSIPVLGSIAVVAGSDTEPPTSPAWVQLDATTGLLSWAPCTDNVGVVAYRVYRAPTAYFWPTPALLFSTVGTTSLNVSQSLGNPAVNYTFRVTALDAASNESTPSAPVGEFDYSLGQPGASTALSQ